MTRNTGSVSDLAVRFSLRGRAHLAEYLSGRRLSESGAVVLVRVDPDCVAAVVTDGDERFEVALVAAADRLSATCSSDGDSVVCRHAVAAEHTLWRHLLA